MRIFFLLLFTITFAQQKQSFYFDFNQFEFNNVQNEQVLNWIKSHPNIQITKIEGFCDWVGNFEYNDILAIKRINTISTLFNQKKINVQDIEKKAFGKRFEQNKQQALNRRVDVYFDYFVEESSEITKPIVVFSENVKVNKLDSIVKKSSIGDKIKLKNLHFYNVSDVVVPKSRPVLAELLQVLIENPKLKIEIHGHICCQPNEPNELISRARAEAVYYYLIKNGINRDRLQYKSFGSSQPIYPIPEKNDFERDENRRVEILILEK